ncbi:MAG TPA: kelch repeat-containing protein, partial [Chitinophagaceae bacterium]
GTASISSIIHSSDGASIGWRQNQFASYPWNGQLDEIRLWNVARSEADIQNNMCQKLTGTESDLIGYWTADESYTSNTVIDKTSPSENGTIIGSVAKITSGAPIGDTSLNIFTNSWNGVSLSLESSGGDQFAIQQIANNPYGVFIYRVDTTPYYATGLNQYPGYYFGVFTVDNDTAATYNVDYDYSFNNGVVNSQNQPSSSLFEKSNGSYFTWGNVNAVLNQNTKQLSLIMQSSRNEYIFNISTWKQEANFGGVARTGAVGFSINGKGYIGTGKDQTGEKLNDFWEYDPSTNVWTQKANFGGAARDNAVGFSIGSYGYIGTGSLTAANSYAKDFWQYDPSTNVWIQKKNFAGAARFAAFGFAVGSKGYVGTGANGNPLQYVKDFYEYDPSTNMWAKKANFGGGSRGHARGFGIGTLGYVGTGVSKTGIFKDFWQFDPFTDTWTKKADFGGTARQDAVAFSIGSVGFLGTGYDVSTRNDFWEYDPTSNTWTQKDSVPGASRSNASAFVINGAGYVGTGADANGNALNDFYQYNTESGCNPCPLPLNVYVSNITTTNATVYWTGNTCAFSYRIRKRPVGTTTWIYSHVDAPDTSHKFTGDVPGTQYEVQVQTYCDSLKTDSSGYTASVYFFSSCNNAVISSVAAVPNPVCKGKSSVLTVTGTLNGATTWQWYSSSCGGTPVGSGSSLTVSPDSSTTYYVRGEGGCEVNGVCSSITVTVTAKPKAKITALGSLDICGTGSVQLQANSGTGYTYKWMLGGVNISGATNQIYTATKTGDYTVKVTNSTGCTKTSNVTTVYSTCKLNEAITSEDNINIYPNPSDGWFVVDIAINNEVDGLVPIQVMNALGETVYVENGKIENGKMVKEIKLDAAPGMYLLRVIIGNRVFSKQISLQE